MSQIRAEYLARGLAPSRTEVGFGRTQPMLAGFWIGTDGDGVGWQFQGSQWRVAMIVAAWYGNGPELAAKRAAFAASHPAWFDFTALHAILGSEDDALRPQRARVPAEGFNKYDPDMVYRYRLLPPTTTVGQVVDLAVAYGELCQRWRFTRSWGS